MSVEPLGLLFDMNYCGGCYRCVAACKEAHGFGGEPEETHDLAADAYCALRPEGEDFSVRNLCRHCVTPSCASVCPVGALQKTELGPVTYDPDKCMGCRYCMVACPFEIPRYEWDSAVPAVRKCDLCFDRLEKGELPACVEACPQEATIVGPRAKLLEEAHQRIADEPEEYHDHVYGETELGGTSVLFLTPFPMESLGYAEALGTEPLPTLTWNVLEKIPGFVVAAGASLMAIWWIANRKDEVARFEADRAAGPGGPDRRPPGYPLRAPTHGSDPEEDR